MINMGKVHFPLLHPLHYLNGMVEPAVVLAELFDASSEIDFSCFPTLQYELI
jgi:hypothetical protein